MMFGDKQKSLCVVNQTLSGLSLNLSRDELIEMQTITFKNSRVWKFPYFV